MSVDPDRVKLTLGTITTCCTSIYEHVDEVDEASWQRLHALSKDLFSLQDQLVFGVSSEHSPSEEEVIIPDCPPVHVGALLGELRSVGHV